MRPLNRWAPALPVTAMKTYSLTMPTRPATCAEINCEHHIKGWASTVVADSDDERLIRRAGRQFIVERQPGGFIKFIFPPGQKCFKAHQHRIHIEQEPIHIVRDGDWRGNPTGRRTGLRAAHWLESFQEDTARINERRERG